MKKAPHTPVQQLEHEADLGLQPAGRRQQQQRRHIARRHPALAARQQRRRRSRLGRRCGRLVASGEGEQHFNPRDALRRAFASTPPRQCKWSGHGQALLGTQWHSLSSAAASATAPRRKPAWGSAMRSAGNRGTNEGAEKHVWSTRLPGGFQDFQDSQRISRRFPEDFRENFQEISRRGRTTTELPARPTFCSSAETRASSSVSGSVPGGSRSSFPGPSVSMPASAQAVSFERETSAEVASPAAAAPRSARQAHARRL